MVIRTLEEVLEIYERYKLGTPINILDSLYKTDSSYLFKKHNLIINPVGRRIIRRRTHYMLYDFKSITTPKESYFLGLLYADGFVTKTGIGLTLKSEDSYIIEELSKYIYGYIKPLRKNTKSNTVGIMLYSKLMVDNLNNYGLVPQKTHLELSIPNMNESLIRHFLRGYFDGDGSIFVCTRTKSLNYLKANICSPTLSILEDFQKYLRSHNIESIINIEKRKGKLLKCMDNYRIAQYDMYRLYIRKKSELYKLYRLMYDNADIYLKRKYNTFTDNIELMNYKYVNTVLTN